MFGSPLPLSIGGQQPLDSMPQVIPPDMPQIKKPGMFGGGKFDIGQAIVAALNGYLAGTGNPVGSQNMQMMQQMMQAKRQREQELSDYDRKRSDDQSDWRTQYDYKVAHPEPTQGSEYERALAASGIMPGTPEYIQHMGNRAAILENPPRYEMVNGALVQVGGPSMSAPKPLTDEDIDRMSGGQTPPASGGFPRY